MPDLGRTHAIEDHLEPGDHLCSLYETKTEQFEIVLPFLAQGLAEGEKCLYAADDNTVAEIKAGLLLHGIDVSKHMASGQLVIVALEDYGVPSAKFEPKTMIAFLSQIVDGALNEGYSGVRIAAEETWLLRDLSSLDAFMEFEAMLNGSFKGRPVKGLCQYNVKRFMGDVLVKVLETHPRVLLGTDLYENPFYEPLRVSDVGGDSNSGRESSGEKP